MPLQLNMRTATQTWGSGGAERRLSGSVNMQV